MESKNSFYDLLKKEYRKKNNVDREIFRKDEMLKNVKKFIKYLIKPNHITEAIETITIIRESLGKGGCTEEFDLTPADFDLILLINAVVLCCGQKWDEAEELLYQLTEKYQESLFFALLGIVKNKRHIFRCSRDTLCLAQIVSHKPEIFGNLNLNITNLNEIQLKGSITTFLDYTKNMEEIPLHNYIKSNDIIEFSNFKTIGNIFHSDIFPIIRNQIDVFLCGYINTYNNKVINNDQSTQTEDINVDTRSIGSQTRLIKTFNASAQTLKVKEKNCQKKDRELTTLRANVDVLKKTNSDLTKRINEIRLSLNIAQNKIYTLEEEIQESREYCMDQETTMLEVIKCAYTSLFHLQKTLGEKSKEKLQCVDAMLSALRSEFTLLGLKKDVGAISLNITSYQNEVNHINKSIDDKQNQILHMLETNQFFELLSISCDHHVPLLEQPDLMLDLIAKLVDACRNKRLTNQYNINEEINLQDSTVLSGASGGGNNSNNLSCIIIPPAVTFGVNTLSTENTNKKIQKSGSVFAPYLEESNDEFPPINRLSRRRLKKIKAQDEFYTFVAKIQSLLPLCTTVQIKRAIKAVQSRNKININQMKLEDVVDYLKSTVKDSTTEDDTRNMTSFWDYDNRNNSDYEEDINSCPICLDPIDHNRFSLQCGHLFHNGCITEWLRSNGNCPICRVSIYQN